MWDIFLIILAILSFVYIVWQVVKRFPRLANIKVDSMPTLVAKRQKDIILKNRLERQSQEFLSRLQDWWQPTGQKISTKFRQNYEKLKNAERDLRRRGYKKLSSAVSQSQETDERLVASKQLINQEEYKKAEEVLLDILSLDHHNIEAYRLLAQVYRSTKEYTQAKETLEYLLKLTGKNDPDIYYYLADIARERGDLHQAEEDYLQSISLARDNYLYFLSLAEVYLDLEDKHKSLETAQKALSLSPNNPKILDFLIKISIIMPDKDLAEQYLNKLEEVNPENNKISEFKDKIGSLD
ncbi:MAG: hypothetical protein C3F02_02165 [Parcubacteria group bacterium]|nr:MAG: hypothetical protein C3F02_02165 [Parcubacteria group bacterium]